MNQNQVIEQVSKIKARYEKRLMQLANVTGIGVGFKHRAGQATDEIALIVNVTHKKPLAELTEQDIIPSELEGISVDVQEVGKIRAL